MIDKTRRLGSSQVLVSTVGLGCMGLSEFYGPITDERDAIALLNQALGLGVTHLDTAELYGMGHNEELLGRALAWRRDQVTIATKFGPKRDPKTREFIGVDGSPEYVRRSCDGSLRRLGIEVIDLYYLHRVDPKTPIEETVGAMARLVEQGKIRLVGLSEASAATLRRAHAVHPIAALQSEYSLFSRDVESEVLPACVQLGVSLVAYSPLGRGLPRLEVQQVDAGCVGAVAIQVRTGARRQTPTSVEGLSSLLSAGVPRATLQPPPSHRTIATIRAWPSTNARFSRKNRKRDSDGISAPSADGPANTAFGGYGTRRKVACRPGPTRTTGPSSQSCATTCSASTTTSRARPAARDSRSRRNNPSCFWTSSQVCPTMKSSSERSTPRRESRNLRLTASRRCPRGSLANRVAGSSERRQETLGDYTRLTCGVATPPHPATPVS